MNLWIIFLTGLTTGGLACLAVQGGLLTSIIANQKDQEIDELESNKDKLKAKKRANYLEGLQVCFQHDSSRVVFVRLLTEKPHQSHV